MLTNHSYVHIDVVSSSGIHHTVDLHWSRLHPSEMDAILDIVGREGVAFVDCQGCGRCPDGLGSEGCAGL